MAFTFECTVCQRQYKASEKMAGKRMRCKQCGNMIEIPTVTASQSNLSADDNAETGTKISASIATPGPVVREVRPDLTRMERKTEGADEYDLSGPSTTFRTRPNKLFAFYMSGLLDTALPIVLLFGNWLWIIWMIMGNDGALPAWVPLVRAALVAGSFFLIILPFTMHGVERAAAELKYSLPPSPKFRTAAIFSLPTALGQVLWIASGNVTYLVIGTILGLIFSVGGLWLLLRLEQKELLKTSLHACGSFLITTFVIGALMFGSNMLLMNIVKATKQGISLPSSPFGSGFSWLTADEIKAASASAAPAPTKPATPVVNTSHATPTPPPPVATVTPPAPASSETPPATFPAPPKPSTVESIKPQAIATDQNTPSVQEEPEISHSPFVRQITPLIKLDAGDDLLRPITFSNWTAVVKHPTAEMDQVELWNLKTCSRRGEPAHFTHRTGYNQTYILSPGGEYLARIVTFPELSVQVLSFKDVRKTWEIGLDQSAGTPSLLGFFSPEQFIVYRTNGMESSIQLFDVKTCQRVSQFNLPPHDVHWPGNITVHPKGKQFAVAGRMVTQNMNIQNGLWLYNLPSPQISRIIRFPELNLQQTFRTTGIAFSPDGSKITAFIEHPANSLLLTWRLQLTSTSTPARFVNPSLLEGDTPPLPASRIRAGSWPFDETGNGQWDYHTLDWVNDSTWLIYGSVLMDAQTGQIIGKLQIDDLFGQWAAEDGSFYAIRGKNQQPRQILKIELDNEKITARKQELSSTNSNPK